MFCEKKSDLRLKSFEQVKLKVTIKYASSHHFYKAQHVLYNYARRALTNIFFLEFSCQMAFNKRCLPCTTVTNKNKLL